MFFIYIHRFVDKDLAKNYFVENWNEYIKYVNDKELSDLLEIHDHHYIVILKDKLLINHVNTQKHYVARKREIEPYVEHILEKDYDYILRHHEEYSTKEDITIPVFLKNNILNDASEMEKLYHLYGLFSLMYNHTNIYNVDNFSKDYIDECKIAEKSKHIIVQDEHYSKLKIINVDNQSIISCDFRRINNIDIVYAIKEDDELDVEYLTGDVEYLNIYTASNFDVEMLYAHLMIDYNVYFSIHDYKGESFDEICDRDSLNDKVWALAANGFYKFVQKTPPEIGVLILKINEVDLIKCVIDFIKNGKDLNESSMVCK